MIFASPYLFLLLLALPAVMFLGYRRRRSPAPLSPPQAWGGGGEGAAAALLYSSTEQFHAIAPSLRHRLRQGLPVLRLAVLALIVLALARPQKGQEPIRESAKGIAIEMVLDASGSMRAEDMNLGGQRMNRLEAVKQVFRDFVAGEKGLDGRPNDVIGMVSFARYPEARCPLTLDHGVLLELVKGTEIVTDPREDGTAIGEAMALSLERIKDAKARSKVMILLTDGQNNVGNAKPLDAAKIAKALDVKIYTIGAGTRGLAPMPVTLPTGETVLQSVRVDIDEATLKEIAATTGGRYFRATDGESLRSIYKEIDAMERVETESVKFLDYKELFPLFLFPGLGLLALEHLLACTWFRRVP